MSYQDFLARKAQLVNAGGFKPADLPGRTSTTSAPGSPPSGAASTHGGPETVRRLPSAAP
jgi:hypothetical protein